MALTLPTEVVTEKNKQGHTPLLLVDFVTLNYYVASKTYTLDDGGVPRDYVDLLKQKSLGTVTHNIPDTVNKTSSVATIKIQLVDYRTTARGNIIGSSPDLTNSLVRVRLKFDTASNDIDDSVIVFEGRIKTYSQKRDVLNIAVETTHFRDLTDSLPANLAIEKWSAQQTLSDDDIAEPLQYGDFSWDDDFLFITDWENSGNGWAICPLVYSFGGKYWFAVSEHGMNTMPTVANIADGNRQDVFIRRDNYWGVVKDGQAGVTNSDVSGSLLGIRNSPPYVDYKTYIYWYMTSDYSGGGGTNRVAPETRDGLSATGTIAAATSGERIKVHTLPHDELITTQITGGSKPIVYISQVQNGSSPYCNLTLRRKSDDSSAGQIEVNDTNLADYLNTWKFVGLLEIPVTEEDEYYFEVEPLGGNAVTVNGIIWQTQVQNFNPDVDELCMYVRCEGRKFSGTWDSRRTADDLITHPVDMIESIFRDEFSITDLNTASFDAVKALDPTAEVGASFIRQQKGEDWLNLICEAFNYGISIAPNGKVVLMKPDTDLNFTQSGTGTPGNEDIITDSETITTGSYNEHPILQGTFKLSRTNPRSIVDQLTVNYQFTFSGTHIRSSSTGSGDVTGVDNSFVNHKPTADALSAYIHNWLSQQKHIAFLSSFLNAVGFQHGDVVNVRHGDLNDDMLVNTVNTEKWMVNGWAFKSGGVVDVQLVQLL